MKFCLWALPLLIQSCAAIDSAFEVPCAEVDCPDWVDIVLETGFNKVLIGVKEATLECEIDPEDFREVEGIEDCYVDTQLCPETGRPPIGYVYLQTGNECGMICLENLCTLSEGAVGINPDTSPIYLFFTTDNHQLGPIEECSNDDADCSYFGKLVPCDDAQCTAEGRQPCDSYYGAAGCGLCLSNHWPLVIKYMLGFDESLLDQYFGGGDEGEGDYVEVDPFGLPCLPAPATKFSQDIQEAFQVSSDTVNDAARKTIRNSDYIIFRISLSGFSLDDISQTAPLTFTFFGVEPSMLGVKVWDFPIENWNPNWILNETIEANLFEQYSGKFQEPARPCDVFNPLGTQFYVPCPGLVDSVQHSIQQGYSHHVFVAKLEMESSWLAASPIGQHDVLQPIPCLSSEGGYSEWSECSETCGGGTRTRTGLIQTSQFECAGQVESESCNLDLCLDTATTIDADLTLLFLNPQDAQDFNKPEALDEMQLILSASLTLNPQEGYVEPLFFSTVPLDTSFNSTSENDNDERRSATYPLTLYFVVYAANNSIATITTQVNDLQFNSNFTIFLSSSTYFGDVVLVDSSNAQASVGCSCAPNQAGGLVWPRAGCGTTISTFCASGFIGTRSRSCSTDGEFSNVNTVDCLNPTLQNLASVEYTPENVANLTKEVRKISGRAQQFGSEDVKNIITVLNKIEAVLETDDTDTVDDFIGVASDALDADEDVFFLGEQASSETTSSASLPRVVEKFARRVSESQGGNGTLSIASPNIIVTTLRINGSNQIQWPDDFIIQPGRTFCQQSCSNTRSFNSTFDFTSISIILPAQIVDVSIVAYRTSRAFVDPLVSPRPSTEPDTVYVDSSVLSATVSQDLVGDVILSFEHNSNVDADRICSFWQYASEPDTSTGVSESSSGQWSVEGCTGVTAGNVTTCTCNHLTNFAILTNFRGSESDSLALSIVSYVAVAVNIICLMLTFFVYLCLPKLRTLPKKLLMHICVNLSVALLIFVAGVDQTSDADICFSMGILLQYFLLTTFFWTWMQGVHLYRTFVKVFNVNTTRVHLIYSAFAYIIPLIIVIISAAVLQHSGYRRDNACWLDVANGAIWAFTGPMMLIFVLNIITFVFVLVRISRSVKKTTDDDRQYRIQMFKAALSFFILLGFAWIFNYFALIDGAVAFEYIFAIAIMLQGILIFVLQCLLDKKVRDHLAERKKRAQASKITTSRPTATKQSASNSSVSDINGKPGKSYQPMGVADTLKSTGTLGTKTTTLSSTPDSDNQVIELFHSSEAQTETDLDAINLPNSVMESEKDLED